jgi:hypothetical protein
MLEGVACCRTGYAEKEINEDNQSVYMSKAARKINNDPLVVGTPI